MMLGRELSEVTADRERRTVDDRAAPYASFRGFGKRRYVAPFDLDLRSGQVVALAGLLGSGRTETARIVFGAERADSGTAKVAGKSVHIGSPREAIRLGFGYCPEERKTEGIVAELSVRENIVLALQARRGWTRPLSRREQDEICTPFHQAAGYPPRRSGTADRAIVGRQPAEGFVGALACHQAEPADPR